MRKVRSFNQKLKSAMLMVAALVAPATASANPLTGFFDSIRNSLGVIGENSGVIMMIIGAIGILLAIIAWGSDSTGQDPKLQKVVKGAFTVIILVEIFLGLMTFG